ncbi:MAG: ABC-F family ATP-binding cassette domain-containing protein [Candidatus Pacebacteria bacterium]|nr:ABC-F family ATP-binding cassette domain-containing protein [Candidatus Paceibacterota bacterium]
MSKGEVVLRFDEVSFEYLHKKPIYKEASFSVRDGSKITLMGQNGAGKSTMFDLIIGKLKPTKGKISIINDVTIGIAKQVIEKSDLNLSVQKYFEKAYDKVSHNAPGEMKKVLDAVNLNVPIEKKVEDLSGGQQARLLLAFALIQKPDILLLDEPTNNLDEDGIAHLINFLMMYEKTVIVISHDADFLNCFTDGVIYLDVFTHKTEQYVGDYYSVTAEIENRIEKEKKKNAQLEKNIKDRKEKVNFFAHKGGKMRKLAKKMKEEIEEDEENKVDVRKEDRTIRDFTIPAQEIVGKIVEINSVKALINGEEITKEKELTLRKDIHMLISGPNGVGKSTFLKNLLSGDSSDHKILEGVRVGYYSQDFSSLDYDQTVIDSLSDAIIGENDIQQMRSIAAGFLITGELMGHKVSDLSEGQKGLLSFARLVLMQPGLLILDEPTNHINFRHIPVIAKALDQYEGTMIMVSHMEEFIEQIRIDEFLDLGGL